MHSLAGQFLISMPKLHDTFFDGALVYVWSHDERGAQGLVVNQPHELTLVKLFEQLDLPFRIGFDRQVADGGPVEPQRGFILHTEDVRVDSSEDAGDGLAITYSREILELIASDQGPRHFLVALGYAGWGAGQLEAELADSAWLTAPSSREALFNMPFKERLDHAAGVLGVDLRLLGADAGHA